MPPRSPAASAMEHKVVNDAVAYIRSSRELRGRNVEWAEQAVRGGASLSATRGAASSTCIDVIARDLPDLLTRIDGREVHIEDRTGETRQPRVCSGAAAEAGLAHAAPGGDHQPHGRLRAHADRHLGLLLEGYNPGAVLPGVRRLDLRC